MDSDQLLIRLGQLMSGQRFAALATSGCTTPYINLVAFASSPDLQRVWFATPRGTRKHANLRTDSRAALLVDNRTNQAADLAQAMAATVMGQATALSGEPLAVARGIYLSKHPGLEEFAASATCAFFELCVTRYVVVHSFQDVTVIDGAQLAGWQGLSPAG